MNGELQRPNATRFNRFLPAQGVCYYIRLARMVLNGAIIVIQKFNPTALSYVQMLLVENMLKTLVIGVDGAFGTVQVMSPNFQRENHCTQLQVMGGVVLLVHLELTRSIRNHFLALHQHATETMNRSITVNNEIISALRQGQNRSRTKFRLQLLK